MNHIRVTFTDILPEQQEWTLAHLAEAGYDGFEEKEKELLAYIPEKDFDAKLLDELAFKYQLAYHSELIPGQNWNKIWESNFPPVVLDDFVAVRADFHPPVPTVRFEILIMPKMSFGTGHHATTSMMIRQMSRLEFSGKRVFDLGTGTGILAILAEKLGAAAVIAADHDHWSVENAVENMNKNQCSRVNVKQMDSLEMEEESDFDIILANINRNVIVEQFPFMVKKLTRHGTILLSGLLVEDKEDIRQLGHDQGLNLACMNMEGNWVSMRFDR